MCVGMMQQVVLTHNYLTDIPLALARLPDLHTLLVSPPALEPSITLPACMVACVCARARARVDEETEIGYGRLQLEHNAIEHISGEEPRDPGLTPLEPRTLNPSVVQCVKRRLCLCRCRCLCLCLCRCLCLCQNHVQTPRRRLRSLCLCLCSVCVCVCDCVCVCVCVSIPVPTPVSVKTMCRRHSGGNGTDGSQCRT
jgi:hypothetical protein